MTLLDTYTRHGDTYLDAMARYLLDDIQSADEDVMGDGEGVALFGRRIASWDNAGFVSYWRFTDNDAAQEAYEEMAPQFINEQDAADEWAERRADERRLSR